MEEELPQDVCRTFVAWVVDLLISAANVAQGAVHGLPEPEVSCAEEASTVSALLNLTAA